MQIRQKGKQYLKRKAIPTLFLSNFDPYGESIYPNMQESISIETFRRRLIPVEVNMDLMRALSSALKSFLQVMNKPCPEPSVQLVETLIAQGTLPPILRPVPAIAYELNPLFRRGGTDLI
jgi:hypothetical protein